MRQIRLVKRATDMQRSNTYPVINFIPIQIVKLCSFVKLVFQPDARLNNLRTHISCVGTLVKRAQADAEFHKPPPPEQFS